MIDTDKYEGHTPAPWSKNIFGSLSQGKMPCNINLDEVSESDAKLIADAPLLLAEVKRLQYELIDAIDNMNWFDDLAGRKEDEVNRLREENDFIEWVKKTHPVWLNNLKEGYRRHKEAIE